MKRLKINDGVFLNHINTSKFESESLIITFTKPISECEASKMALLPYVLNSGSKNYPTSLLIQRKLKSLYGAVIEPSVRKKGEFLTISIASAFIKSKYTDGESLLLKVYDIAHDILFNPLVLDGSFDEKIVEAEKNNLIDLINSQKNDKRVYANRRMFEIMCKNEPYSLNKYGKATEVSKITAKNLFETYINVIETAEVNIFYSGSEKIENIDFSNFKARKELNYKTKTKFDKVNVNEVIETLDITQGKLSMGFRTNITANDEDYPALVMFNTMLGGSTSSKLFTNVREKMSLCYYASSNIDKIKGVMSINSGVEAANYKIAKEAILKEFEDMKKGEFTNEELISAKLTVVNNLKMAKDSTYATEDFYLTNALLKDNNDIDKLIEDIEKVSKGQIVAAANKVVLDTIYFLKGDE